jgi:hypothetical protein
MGQIPGRLRTFACKHAHSTDREALTPVAAPRTQKSRRTEDTEDKKDSHAAEDEDPRQVPRQDRGEKVLTD